MAYTVPADAIAEMQYRYKLGGQQLINVFHYKLNDETLDGRAVIEEAATEFYNAVGLFIAARQTTEVSDIHVRGQWVYPIRYAFYKYIPDTTAGVEDPPTLSIGTSIVLKKISDLAGHSHRGRVFVGGAPVSDAVVGTLTSGALGNWGTVAGKMVLDVDLPINLRIIEPVIWSYTDPTHADEIVQTNADPVLRYQRRREVGSGE